MYTSAHRDNASPVSEAGPRRQRGWPGPASGGEPVPPDPGWPGFSGPPTRRWSGAVSDSLKVENDEGPIKDY